MRPGELAGATGAGMLAAGDARAGFRPFRVAERIAESRIVTSFRLVPLDPADWRPFRPGQHLVLRLADAGADAGAGAGAPVLRTYTISSSPQERGSYRISVKREAAPAPGLPDGLVSCHLHDRVEVGQELMVDGPRGTFTLAPESRRPVVLLSGGVGLTPMVSMLHALVAEGERQVWFIHACENGGVHAMADEVRRLAAGCPLVRTHFCYRAPTGADRAAGRFDSEGLLSRATIQALLPLDDYEIYLCGPPPFMEAMRDIFLGLGVRAERIAREFFTAARRFPTEPAPASAPESAPVAEALPAADGPMVELAASGRRLAWDGRAASLLDFLEERGIEPDFSCRAGICGTCRCRLVSGEVAYVEEPLDPPAPGEVLLCCARPLTPVVIDL